MGGEELKWHQLAQHQLMNKQMPLFSPHSKAKASNRFGIHGEILYEEVLDYYNYDYYE